MLTIILKPLKIPNNIYHRNRIKNINYHLVTLKTYIYDKYEKISLFIDLVLFLLFNYFSYLFTVKTIYENLNIIQIDILCQKILFFISFSENFHYIFFLRNDKI